MSSSASHGPTCPGMSLEQQVAGLKLDVERLQKTLADLIAWTATSANSPIRRDEASVLLNQLRGL